MTVVALIQFVGASVLIMIVLSTLLDPGANLASQRWVATLVYLLTRRNMAQNSLIPIVMPLAAAYLIATGYGLWTLRKWARHIVVGTSGLTVILWLRAILVREWAMGDRLFANSWARQVAYATILLNAFICGSLILYPEVARAFSEEE